VNVRRVAGATEVCGWSSAGHALPRPRRRGQSFGSRMDASTAGFRRTGPTPGPPCRGAPGPCVSAGCCRGTWPRPRRSPEAGGSSRRRRRPDVVGTASRAVRRADPPRLAGASRVGGGRGRRGRLGAAPRGLARARAASPTPADERKVRELVGVAASLRRALAVEGRGLTPAELWCRAVDGSAPPARALGRTPPAPGSRSCSRRWRSVGVTWRGGGVARARGAGPPCGLTTPR
jgi:hypothetical protein